MYFGSKRKSAARRLKLRDRIISMLLAVSLLCGNPIVLPTGAAELVAYCGIEEHSHSEECYTTDSVLTCGVTQENHVHSEACKQTEKTLTCTIVEQVHEHTDACYTTTTNLTCTEHVHTADCAQLTCTDTTEGHAHTDACYAYTCADPDSTHHHTDSCYTTESVLNCDYHQHTDECYTTTEVNTCGVTQENHTHSDACYGEQKTLSCTRKEHTHTSACYSNPEADLETADDWEDKLPKEDDFTGVWTKDLLAVVQSQVGYQESVSEDGSMSGYNRYGAWYSSYTQDENQPYLDWNVTFLFFSIYYSGISDFPLEETCADWVKFLNDYDLYRAAGEYTPNPGDLVFTDTNADGVADRAGIVSEVTEDELTAIEGDYEGTVAKVTYDLPELTAEAQSTEAAGGEESGISISQSSVMLLSDDTAEPEPTVLGYADMTQAQADVQPETAEAVMLATPSNGDYIYINISGATQWNEFGYHDIRLWYKTTSDSWAYSATVEETSDQNIYKLKLPSNMNITNSAFVLVRLDPSKNVSEGSTSWNNDATWNQAKNNGSDLTLQDGANMLMVTSSTAAEWSSTWYGTDDDEGTTGTIVDIETTTFEPAADVLYVDSTFYDYYTDYELDGKNRDTNTTAFSASHDTWVTFRNFNTALSNYYSNANVKIPLYVGHFQPTWADWGYTFASADLPLYGFADGNAYGTTSSDQRYFMSVNNSHMDSAASISSGLYSYAAQGLVNNALVSDSLMSVKKTSGTAALPMFSAAFINGANSQNRKLGDVYQNVSFPFTKKDINNNGVEYWIFDSAETTLEMKQDSATGDYFLKAHSSKQDWAKNVDSSSTDKGTYGFFPFNSGSTSCNANTYNYGFGCRLDIPFRLTEDGTVLNNSGSAIPITFDFSGDDDVWVFIDGQLVLDIGGSHGKVDGKINFAKKEATVSNVKVNPGTGNSGTTTAGTKTYNFEAILPDNTNTSQHTLTMFYMERGMWESNMKVTFNFPEENLLEVEKRVNTSGVNSLFQSSFENQDLFTFNIKTLATHFGTKEASASGEGQKTAINVDLTKCSLSNQTGITFEKKDFEGKSGIHWYTDIADANGEYRDRRWGQIDLGTAYSMSGYETLDLEFYYDYTDTPGLSYIFIKLLNGSGNVVSVTGSHKGYPGFANRTVGSVTMGNKQWISISLDLDDLLQENLVDPTVRYIQLGYDYPRDVYFSNISFQPEQVVDNTTVGFVLPQDQIPDYGSANSGQLEIPVNAVYTSSDNSTYRIGSSGTFVLHDEESVTFSDQFRRGSYMYLEEQESYLYDTTWKMYEGTNERLVTTSAVPSGATTVTGTAKDMPGTDTRIVTDGRIEKKGLLTGETSGENAYQNANTAASPGNTFVFRHYTDPDNTSVTTKLKVVYTNTIKTGTLTITKAQAESSAELDGQEFTFYVVFQNVGGMSLESAPIVYGPFTLTKGQSKEIKGIPLGTWYKIHEVKDTNNQDIILENVGYNLQAYGTGTMLPTSDTLTVGSDTFDTYSVEGLIPTTGGEKSKVSFTFNNSRKSVVDLTVNKVWSTTGTVTLPTSIYVQLQSSADGEKWTAVKDYKKVQLAPGYNESWDTYTYTFENLDKIDTDTNKEYQYRVVELDSEDKVIESTSENPGVLTVNGTTYQVTYGEVSNAKDDSSNDIENQLTQTITNTLSPKAKVTVTKVWNVFEGMTAPESVTVQLQRRTGTNDFAKIDGVADVTLTQTLNWTHTFENLDEKDSDGNAYEYRVVELNNNTVISANGTFTVDGVEYRVTYSGTDGKADPVTGTTNEYTQTITNTVVPEVTLQITKRDATNTDTLLDGVEFKLEKDGDSTFVENVTTGTDGIASFTGLKAGTYTLTETKAKSGYSLLKSSIEIVITESVADNGAITYTATVDSKSAESFELSGNTYTLGMTVYNKQGLTMPSTGGTHGFEYWILGGLCITAIPLLLYTLLGFKKGGKYSRK